jgi:hypothetical protein
LAEGEGTDIAGAQTTTFGDSLSPAKDKEGKKPKTGLAYTGIELS